MAPEPKQIGVVQPRLNGRWLLPFDDAAKTRKAPRHRCEAGHPQGMQPYAERLDLITINTAARERHDRMRKRILVEFPQQPNEHAFGAALIEAADDVHDLDRARAHFEILFRYPPGATLIINNVLRIK